MARAREAVRAAAFVERGDPAKALALANRVLHAASIRAAVNCAALDPGARTLSIADAGDSPAFLVRSGSVQPLARTGPTLGLGPETFLSNERVALVMHDTLVFWSRTSGGASLTTLLAPSPPSAAEIAHKMQSANAADAAVLVVRIV
jgi:serine phosphatase RsbU (regulator of sigma subunit)